MEHSISINHPRELGRVVEWLYGWLSQRSTNVVALYGAMGAGKTTLVSALARSRGAQQPASSPTFAIVNAYELAVGVIYHFDFYRIEKLEEVLDLGFFDYTDSGALCIIEWPERVEPLLDELSPLRIVIDVDNSTSCRTFTVAPATPTFLF